MYQLLYNSLWIIGLAAGVVSATIINVTFARGMYRDASVRHKHRSLLFAPPFVWSLATLIGGVFIVSVYWWMHVSSLSLYNTQPDHPNPFTESQTRAAA